MISFKMRYKKNVVMIISSGISHLLNQLYINIESIESGEKTPFVTIETVDKYVYYVCLHDTIEIINKIINKTLTVEYLSNIEPILMQVVNIYN